MVRLLVDVNGMTRNENGHIAILMRSHIFSDIYGSDAWRFNSELIEFVNECDPQDQSDLTRAVRLFEKYELKQYGFHSPYDIWGGLYLDFVEQGREFVILETNEVYPTCHYEYIQYLPLPPPEGKNVYCF